MVPSGLATQRFVTEYHWNFEMQQPTLARAPRVDAIDALRGLVMIIMALDHTRAFWGASGWDPDPGDSTAGTFMTRWITHFCAPVFVLLAGTSAALSLARGRSKGNLSAFLVTRGMWLALLDLTVVSFAWFFRIGEPFVTDVIWVIGWSMVVLAALIRLPGFATAIFGLVLVVGHNGFDAIRASSFGPQAWVWNLVHEPGLIPLWGEQIWWVGYPLVPWVGVMALGYGLGRVLPVDPHRRRRMLITLGAALVVLFIVLRAINLYGDPRPWSKGPDWVSTVFSFVNCEKYPPSLLFLLMTIGPAMLGLAALDGMKGQTPDFLLVLGRVPLLFYVVHLYLIHAAAALYFAPRFGTAAFHVDPDSAPAGFGVPLTWVYAAWIALVIAIYPVCARFDRVKQSRRGRAWLTYL